MGVIRVTSYFSKSLLLAASLVVSMPAISSTITLDGIIRPGEYTGPNSGTESLLWWNGHHSIYTKAAGNTNTLFWEINDVDALFSLNLFFEVPTYARRMIWAPNCDYSGSGSDADCDAIPDVYLDAYDAGSHHASVKMDYKTQTESEFFKLNGINKKIFWQDEDSTEDGFDWATSREYLIDRGICTTSLCLEFDRTASIEMIWRGFATEDDALYLLGSITDMELHLSDEARGLPPVSVPEPSILVLLSIGLAVLGFRRRGRNKWAQSKYTVVS